jgi:predicted short-subunit dehydrogenase-like oxidoreductase (DUF2520 family)
MTPFDVTDDVWPLHAAACTAAANFSRTLLDLVDDIAQEAHIPTAVARAAYGTLALRNLDAARADGPVAGLAGPITRGDVDSVALQIDAVREAVPTHAATFDSLMRATVQMAFAGGRIDVDTAAALASVVASVASDDDVELSTDHDEEDDSE